MEKFVFGFLLGITLTVGIMSFKKETASSEPPKMASDLAGIIYIDKKVYTISGSQNPKETERYERAFSNVDIMNMEKIAPVIGITTKDSGTQRIFHMDLKQIEPSD